MSSLFGNSGTGQLAAGSQAVPSSDVTDITDLD